MYDLGEFKAGLDAYLAKGAYARPLVCEGSPLKCRSFIVGLNAATRLSNPFLCYWSNSTGFIFRPLIYLNFSGAEVRRGLLPCRLLIRPCPEGAIQIAQADPRCCGKLTAEIEIRQIKIHGAV